MSSVDDWGRRRRLGRARPCHADHCRSSLEAGACAVRRRSRGCRPCARPKRQAMPAEPSLGMAGLGGVAAAELHSVAEPTAAARQGCKARTIDVRGCWTLRRAAGALWLARSDLGSVDDWGRRRRLGRARPCHADHCRSSLEATCVCHELWRSLVGLRNIADHDRREHDRIAQRRRARS